MLAVVVHTGEEFRADLYYKLKKKKKVAEKLLC